MTEYCYHVDEKDNVIGRVTRKEMRDKVLRHRGSNIIVFNSKGELLIHKRTMTKDLFPGYWDTCVGGVMEYGETYDKTAKREVEEELGIKNPKLEFVFKGKFEVPKNKFWSKNYVMIHDGPFKPQPEEVKLVKFISLKDLDEYIKKEKFCPDGIMLFKKFMEVYDEKHSN